jgi:hypothetical protein
MGVLQGLELQLNSILGANDVYQLPQETKKAIAGTLWLIALVLGLLQLWVAWDLWHTAQLFTGYFWNTYTGTSLGLWALYLSVVLAVGDAVVLLLAIPAIKRYKKQGWNLLYYSVLLNAAYGLARIFSEISGGFGYFIFALILCIAATYLLFQVRPLFLPRTVKTTRTKHAAASN